MQEKLEVIKNKKGFIAALDQSGGSTPKALKMYGINEEEYVNEEEMFNLINAIRKRIVTSNSFNSNYIIGTILFKKTLDVQIDGLNIVDYLWNKKQVVTFLKIDKGKEEEKNGVMLLKPIDNLDSILSLAKNYNVFGTKMRSVIKKPNRAGIKAIVDQQFFYAKKIIEKGLIPIVEPEVDINAEDKMQCEIILKEEIDNHLKTLNKEEFIVLKLTIPTIDNFYLDYTNHPNVLRVVALSGGYSMMEANKRLQNNINVVASFSRALLEGLNKNQTSEEFDRVLSDKVKQIYNASINK